MNQATSSPKNHSFDEDIQSVLEMYRKAPVGIDESDQYESELSDAEDLDRYDSTFVVDDDEIIEESNADINEESLLSDPSDLFDNQTESEPESEPEIIYRERKLPSNPLIDDEADEDDDVLIEDDYDCSILDQTYEGDSDSEGPRHEITQPLDASDYVDEEAVEHNDLDEMYGGIVGHAIISSDEEEAEDDKEENHTRSQSCIILDSDSTSDHDQSDSNTDIIIQLSSPSSVSSISPVKIKKRRRLITFDTDTESSVQKVIKRKRNDIEFSTPDSSIRKDDSVRAINPPILSPLNGTKVQRNGVKSHYFKRLILDSDDDDEENSNSKTTESVANVNVDLISPQDTLSSPSLGRW